MAQDSLKGSQGRVVNVRGTGLRRGPGGDNAVRCVLVVLGFGRSLWSDYRARAGAGRGARHGCGGDVPVPDADSAAALAPKLNA